VDGNAHRARKTEALIMTSQLQTLRWQFELTWRLAVVHLPALTDDACLWEPAAGSWTVRRSADGKWRPDWIEPEPDPAPTVTIGWLTWHLTWWWSGVLAALRDETPTARHETFWPGSADAVVRRLNALYRLGRRARRARRGGSGEATRVSVARATAAQPGSRLGKCRVDEERR
jgi:hypothetical protein